MYIRLKTDHSLLESTLKLQDALKLTCDVQSPFFAVCETGHFGSIAIGYNQTQKLGLKFVAAIELQVQIGGEVIPIIAICKNQRGYRLLVQKHDLLSRILELDFLIQFDVSDIILIPTLTLTQLDFVSHFQKYANVGYVGLLFAERLQSFEVKRLKESEKEHGIVYCMMNKIVMQNEKEYKTRSVLHAIKTNSRELIIDDTITQTFLSPERLMKLVDAYPELYTRIHEIVAMTDFKLDKQGTIPHYPFLNGETSDVFLKQLVMKGAVRRYQSITNVIQSRVTKELQTITQLGFADYFLILWDAKRYAFQNDILFGPGRGSSVGSIVAYCLGITEVDPIRYGLVFERFLNPGRKSYPDIDIDVADDKRDMLIAYIQQRYGVQKVAHILTYGTFGAKSAFREVARIHGVSQIKIGTVTKHILTHERLRTSYKESDALQKLLRKDNQLFECFRIALQIEGLKRNTSTHAAGIIITDDELTNVLPVFFENGYTSAWEMKELEGSGFLKIDFLGLKNLSILDKLEQLINEQDITFQINQIPLEDTKTYEYLAQGLTNGIFQLESGGIKKVLRDLKPTQFEDIVAVLALYRPGPMESIPLFIARKHGKASVEMPHPDLLPILAETYGVIVYQEQIMQIVHQMGHFDFVQADDFRRAISKKDEELLKRSLLMFEQAAQKNGYAEVDVKKVSNLMLQFANYGFVKGHAVAYALIAYRLMYCKTHYPHYFYTILLNHHIQDIMKIIPYVHEMKRRDIQFLPPDIILSIDVFKTEKNAIRMGLCSIKGIGKQTAKQIVSIVMSSNEQTVERMLQILLQNGVSKEHLESLIVVGAFDRFQKSRQTLVKYVQEQGSTQEYSHLSDLVDVQQEMKHYSEYTLKECETFERMYLGYPFFQNVFSAFEKEYVNGNLVPIQNLKTKTAQVYQTVGRVVSIQKHTNRQTQFVQIEDNTSELSAVLFDAALLYDVGVKVGEVYHFHIKCSVYKSRSSYQILKISPIISS